MRLSDLIESLHDRLYRKRESRELMALLNREIEKTSARLTDMNRTRWDISHADSFGGRMEMLKDIEDVSFLTEDALHRMARARTLCREGEHGTAKAMVATVPEQLDQAERRYFRIKAAKDQAMQWKG